MTTHTPGPWTQDGEAVTAARPGNPHATVADTSGDHTVPDDEKLANAALIADAPALLALVRRFACPTATGPDEAESPLADAWALLAKYDDPPRPFAPGDRAVFQYPAEFVTLPDHTAHAGQIVTVIRQLADTEYDPEDAGESMFEVRAADGWAGHAWQSELVPVESWDVMRRRHLTRWAALLARQAAERDAMLAANAAEEQAHPDHAAERARVPTTGRTPAEG